MSSSMHGIFVSCHRHADETHPHNLKLATLAARQSENQNEVCDLMLSASMRVPAGMFLSMCQDVRQRVAQDRHS